MNFSVETKDMNCGDILRVVEGVTKECVYTPVDSGCGEKYLPCAIRFILHFTNKNDIIGEYDILANGTYWGMWKKNGHFRYCIVDFLLTNYDLESVSIHPITLMDS